MSDKKKIPAPELHSISLSELRDFSTPVPDYPLCSLCNKDVNKECKCYVYVCKCNIPADQCEWPECICESCLNFKEECVC